MCLSWIGNEVVSEGEMPLEMGRARCEGVYVVGACALGVGFAEIASGFDAELAHDFVAQSFDCWIRSVELIERADFDQDVDDWFGEDTRDRGAPDVIDGDRLMAECGREDGSLGLESLFPMGIMGDDEWNHG